jgi:hypothetical protein
VSQQTQTDHTRLPTSRLQGHICSCASSPYTHIPMVRPCVVHPSAPTRRIDRAAMHGWLSRRYCTQRTHSRPLSDRHQHPTQQQQDPKPTSNECRPACCVHYTGKPHKKQLHQHDKRAWVCQRTTQRGRHKQARACKCPNCKAAHRQGCPTPAVQLHVDKSNTSPINHNTAQAC